MLGPTELRAEDGTTVKSVLAQPKRLALLVYLAVECASDFCRRDTLLGIFWAEREDDRARNTLRQSLFYLRKSLGPDLFEKRGDDELRLNPSTFSADVADFRAAIARGDTAGAIALYRGDFLDGFYLDDCPAFDRWVDEQRQNLLRLAWGAAQTAAADEATDLTDRLTFARFATRVRPLSEKSARTLISLLQADGDRSAALQCFERLRGALRTEFDSEPEPETLELIEAIRTSGPPEPTNTSAPSLATVPSSNATDAPSERPEPGAVGQAPRLRRFWPVTLLAAGAAALILLAGLPERRPDVDPDDTADDPLVISALDRNGRVLIMPLEPLGAESEQWGLDAMAQSWFERRIVEGGIAEIVSHRTIASTVPDTERVDLALAAETAMAELVISGEYLVLGDTVSVTVRVVRAPGLETQFALPRQQAALADPISAFDTAANSVLASLAKHYSTTWRFDPNQAPPSLEVLALEMEALDAFYTTDYDRFHVLADSVIAMDSTYFPARLHLHRTAAYWNQQRFNASYLDLALANHRFLESRADRLSAAQQEQQWAATWLRGDPVTEYALTTAEWRRRDGQGPAYRLAAAANRTNRNSLALELIETRYVMHPGGANYRAWDQTHHEVLLKMHDFEGLLAAAREAQTRHTTYGRYLRHEIYALAGLGRFEDVGEVIERSRVYPTTAEFNPGTHSVDAARILYALREEELAASFARRAHRELEALSRTRPDLDVRPGKAEAMGYAGDWSSAAELFADVLSGKLPPRVQLETMGRLGAALTKSGDSAAAKEVVHRLEELEIEYEGFYLVGLTRFARAQILAELGRREDAIRMVDAAVASGKIYLEWVVTDPHLRELQDDERYQAVIAEKPR